MSGPQKLASIVYEHDKLNSLNTTTLAVFSFCFWTANEQSLKLNIGEHLSNILGKIFSFCLTIGSTEVHFRLLFPYINTFFLREWAWKSHYKTTSLSSINLLSNILVWNIVGLSLLDGSIHCLFKSTPAKLHLYDPFTTPSIFNIGTILNTKFSLNILASMEGPVK